MTNFFASLKLNFSLVCVAAVLCLQGCGGERTTSFNPSVSSSSSSTPNKVLVELLVQGTDPYHEQDYSDKRVQAAREEKDYFFFKDSFTTALIDKPNFEKGQVVVVDLGAQDTCKQHLEFSSLRAEEAGDEAVKVVISYKAKAAVTSNCTSTTPRPFYFYYVDSRDQLIISETIL